MSASWWLINAPRFGGGLLCIFAIALIAYALFRDRPRGRKRCPKCWYDLSAAIVGTTQAIEGIVCPECGTTIKSALLLLRTRRNYRQAFVGVLLASVGAQLVMLSTPGRKGWWGCVPTAIMLIAVDDYTARTPITEALVERLQRGLVTPWDRRAAVWLELHRTEIDWDGMVFRRSKWPVGVPMLVEVDSADGSRSMLSFRHGQLEWLDGQSEPAEWRASPPNIHVMWGSFPKYWIELPPPQLGENTYRFRVTVVGEYGSSRSELVTVRVEGVPSVDDVIEPISDLSVLQEIRHQLVWSIHHDFDKVYVRLGHREPWTPLRSDLAYALQFELRTDGELLGVDDTGHLWGNGPSVECAARIPYWVEDPGYVTINRLHVRITGAPIRAVQNLRYNRYWSGTIEADLRALPWEVPAECGVASVLCDPSQVEAIPIMRQDQERLAKELPPSVP